MKNVVRIEQRESNKHQINRRVEFKQMTMIFSLKMNAARGNRLRKFLSSPRVGFIWNGNVTRRAYTALRMIYQNVT